MEVRTYTERSNARRAARVAGVDPSLVFETEDGFTFPTDGSETAGPPRIVGRYNSAADPARIVGSRAGQTAPRAENQSPANDGLDIPEVLKRIYILDIRTARP